MRGTIRRAQNNIIKVQQAERLFDFHLASEGFFWQFHGERCVVGYVGTHIAPHWVRATGILGQQIWSSLVFVSTWSEFGPCPSLRFDYCLECCPDFKIQFVLNHGPPSPRALCTICIPCTPPSWDNLIAPRYCRDMNNQLVRNMTNNHKSLGYSLISQTHTSYQIRRVNAVVCVHYSMYLPHAWLSYAVGTFHSAK